MKYTMRATATTRATPPPAAAPAMIPTEELELPLSLEPLATALGGVTTRAFIETVWPEAV
jgi:hypothetical protein